ILAIYVARGVDFEGQRVHVLPCVNSLELGGLRNCCRKRLNRTDFVPLVAARADRGSCIAIWIDRHRRIADWIHAAKEKSLQNWYVKHSVAAPAPCKTDGPKKSRIVRFCLVQGPTIAAQPAVRSVPSTVDLPPVRYDRSDWAL